MDASKDIEPITTLKRDAAELIARAKERQSPIAISPRPNSQAPCKAPIVSRRFRIVWTEAAIADVEGIIDCVAVHDSLAAARAGRMRSPSDTALQ